MISLDIRADMREVTRYLTDIQRKQVPRATVMALNRTGRATLTVARRVTAKSMGIGQKEIKDQLFLNKATITRKVATVGVNAKGFRSINLIKWKARETKKGVRYRMHGSKIITDAFISPGRGGNLLVFRRAGKERLPLIPKTGPSVASVFSRSDVQGAVDARARSVFRLEFNRALNRRLGRTA